MIISPAIQEYIEQLIPPAGDLLSEMEELARVEQVPIINRTSIHFICTMLQYKGDVSRILEIGTAIGYSTIWLASLSQAVQVDSVERDAARHKQAKEFINRAGLEGRVQLHLADARDYAARLKGPYDAIFIDAAKGQYQLFFESYAPLLTSGGMIITDNVFFRGYVAEEYVEQKRLRPMVEKIKKYNQWLKEHAQFETSFIPLGDGLALSIKR